MPRPANSPSDLCGLLVVDKPTGWTSMAVVRQVRRAAGGARTGHAGTLDPLATGVLVCCLGPATRFIEHLMDFAKVYEAAIDLSAFSATDDREGDLVPVAVDGPPPEGALREGLASFVGAIEQAPPAYSAVHVGGRRAYELARRGAAVAPPARVVRVHALELLEYRWPIAAVRVTCGRGTYIRSLARDLGRRLGTGGHLASLRRTAVGPYDLTVAVPADRLRRPLAQADLLAAPR